MQMNGLSQKEVGTHWAAREGHHSRFVRRWRLTAKTCLLVLAVVAWRSLEISREMLCFSAPRTDASMARRTGLLGALGAALAVPSSPESANAALLDILASEVPATVVASAFSVTAPSGFEVLEQTKSQVRWRGDKVQPMEGMTAAAEVTKASTLAQLFGPNVTEAGERIASTLKGSPFLVNATTEDPTGSGLDVYQFDIVTNRYRELSMYALVRSGAKNVLCYVSVKTPAQLFEDTVFVDKEATFRKVLSSFTPVEPQSEPAR
mmetsp:Transcript_30642/g.55988  ORF Transcript_30642/g.55988 Transcript_30642/m.55988 type:complete len:263 (+) Transcript_30642:50-838(+)